jgi:DNA-binding NtrC family response regulator
MQKLKDALARIAPIPSPVLIAGESGSGKEVVARELHRRYGKGTLVALNCGAIPENLLEAEVFGVAKGAFTGAGADRPGLLEAADGGTLFLDEIGELPLSLQVKLNRVLEEGEFRRVGETRPRRVVTRVVAATHRDLEEMVRAGTFREDLYFRLKVIQIRVPPLRERIEDIPLLGSRFLHLASARYGTAARRLSPEALALLEANPWPGNVRELRHALEHAAVLTDGELVDAAQLPDTVRTAEVHASPGTLRAARERGAEQAGREYLLQLLRRLNGNVTRAAAEAGLERESLHRALRSFGIDPAKFRG